MRLGSEGSARRTENIHHEDDYGPGSIQQPKHPARNGACPGRQESPPLACGRRSDYAKCMLGPAHTAHPKPPGMGVGVSLITSAGSRQSSSNNRRTSTGQTPSGHRIKTAKQEVVLQKTVERPRFDCGRPTFVPAECIRTKKERRISRLNTIPGPPKCLSQ